MTHTSITQLLVVHQHNFFKQLVYNEFLNSIAKTGLNTNQVDARL
jgi:hypothetical protein